MDDPLLWLALVAVGLGGGFLSGMIGIGGGVVFAPALLLAFEAVGVRDPVLAPLTVGTSLLCTFAAASMSARRQWVAGRVDLAVAVPAGIAGAIASSSVVVLVTSQPWFSRRVFAAVLGAVLVAVVLRMLFSREREPVEDDPARARQRAAGAAGIGAAGGTVAALAGVGGGIVFVPAFNAFLRMPLKRAAGTSALAIVVTSAAGVLSAVARGWGADVPPGALGYVGWQMALAVALPALVAARAGVWTSGRVDVRVVRYTFAAVAFVVGVRLLWSVLG